MKKTRLLLAILMLITSIPYGLSLAEKDVNELSMPKAMPENNFGYCWIGGTETEGATFVIDDVNYNDHVLRISVIQLPNDDYTALVDRQVDAGPDDVLLDKEIATASQYGSKILGTLCDILTISDEKGNNLMSQYSVSSERSGASLANVFDVYVSPENTISEINVELEFGVNEDLSSLFPMSDSVNLHIPVSSQSGQ